MLEDVERNTKIMFTNVDKRMTMLEDKLSSIRGMISEITEKNIKNTKSLRREIKSMIEEVNEERFSEKLSGEDDEPPPSLTKERKLERRTKTDSNLLKPSLTAGAAASKVPPIRGNSLQE